MTEPDTNPVESTEPGSANRPLDALVQLSASAVRRVSIESKKIEDFHKTGQDAIGCLTWLPSVQVNDLLPIQWVVQPVIPPSTVSTQPVT